MLQRCAAESGALRVRAEEFTQIGLNEPTPTLEEIIHTVKLGWHSLRYEYVNN